MNKLVHALTLEGFKRKYPDWEQSISQVYKSVCFTDDGYLYTHGKIFQMLSLSGENPYGLDFQLNNQELTVAIAGYSKTVNLPIIDLQTSTNEVFDINSSQGVYTINHISYLDSNTVVGPNEEINYNVNIPQLQINKYGHVIDAINRQIRIDLVKQNLSEENKYYYLLFGDSDQTTTGETNFNTNIKANLFDGSIYAKNYYINNVTLDKLFSPIQHAVSDTTYGVGTNVLYGHVKLSDSTIDTSGVLSGIAATPKAINDALTSAKQYAKDLLSSTDAMLFVGTINGNGVIQSHSETVLEDVIDGETNISNLSKYEAGWTFRFTTSGTFIENVEPGDMLICINNKQEEFNYSDFTIIQNNIDGAVIKSQNLIENSIILGSGIGSIKSLPNGSNDQVLKIKNGIPTWDIDINTWRPVKYAGITLDDNQTALEFKAEGATTLQFNGGVLTISSVNTVYEVGEGLQLEGNLISLKTATSSELGGVKSSTTGTTPGRDYKVEVLLDGTMKVNVPWDNSTYDIATYNYAGLIKPFKSYTTAATGIEASSSNSNVTVNEISTVTNRYYALEIDNQGRAFTNIPWVNTYRPIKAYNTSNNFIEILGSTNTNSLNFSSEFVYEDELSIGWAEIDSSGNVTYTH